jgi:hypothetical protein
MNRDELKIKITERTQNKKLPCKLAFQMEKEYKTDLRVIGEIANELDIKIINCQLGCFK